MRTLGVVQRSFSMAHVRNEPPCNWIQYVTSRNCLLVVTALDVKGRPGNQCAVNTQCGGLMFIMKVAAAYLRTCGGRATLPHPGHAAGSESTHHRTWHRSPRRYTCLALHVHRCAVQLQHMQSQIHTEVSYFSQPVARKGWLSTVAAAVVVCLRRGWV